METARIPEDLRRASPEEIQKLAWRRVVRKAKRFTLALRTRRRTVS